MVAIKQDKINVAKSNRITARDRLNAPAIIAVIETNSGHNGIN